MASCTCLVTLLIAAYTRSVLAAPSPDTRRLSDARLPLAQHADVEVASSHEDPALRRPMQPHDVDLLQINYPPLHNNVRRRHRKRKLVNGVWRASTRRSDTGEQPRAPARTKDSEVAIILAKLNTDTDGAPTAVRPYRLQAGGRDITPLQDDSDETINNILQALKLQVTTRKKITDLNRRANTTPPGDSLQLEGKLGPQVISKYNDSTNVIQEEPQLNSLENLTEANTEPTYESVIQSGTDDDALKVEASTLPSEYSEDINNDEPKSLDNDDNTLYNEEPKTSIESKIVSEPADTNVVGDEEEQVTADMQDPEPILYSQTKDGATKTCPAENAVSQADSQCAACKEGDSQCEACKEEDSQGEACTNGDSQCEASKFEGSDNIDVSTISPDTCPALPILAGRNAEEEALPILAGRNAEEEPQEHEVDFKDDATKKDVALKIDRKSYKISIIFQ